MQAGMSTPELLGAQNRPRRIQAAAGSCFAFAKTSVSRQITLRCRERLAFAPQSRRVELRFSRLLQIMLIFAKVHGEFGVKGETEWSPLNSKRGFLQ
jgi:hypothetical protein